MFLQFSYLDPLKLFHFCLFPITEISFPKSLSINLMPLPEEHETYRKYMPDKLSEFVGGKMAICGKVMIKLIFSER